MEFRILGPIEVVEDGVAVRLAGGRQQALLGLLLLNANRVVSADRLMLELWPDEPPTSGVTALHNRVSQLRKVLEPGRARGSEQEVIVSRPPGYLLRAEPERIDATRFEQLLGEGRRLLVAGDAARAAETLREALSLWRGPALGGLADQPALRSEADRLEELRLGALEERIEAELASGHASELVAELRSLVAEHPLRERPRGQLMLALYRSDRQAEALEAYHDARKMLVDELGIDPSAELQQLERAILRQDESLRPGERERLPSGTLTLLFTDIEGSTRLLHETGERYADLLAEHRRLIREAVAAHGGAEVDTQGDAHFVVFTRASDAVASAQEMQRLLADQPIRVRIGLHTGEPLLTEEGYVGIDIHRAARIAAAGHGGQVLLSQTTRDLVEADVRDLGLHRLKDLAEPVRLYQLGHHDFAPLKSLNQTNLPLQPTSFVGRDRELEEVLGLLRGDDVRLLTLTGPGGAGKTRLAITAAGRIGTEFADGVFFVPLTTIPDPALVVPAIAQALGISEREKAPAEALTDHLADKEVLLVLDNFEHILEAAAFVGELLAAAGELRVLATSREHLGLHGEHEYPVPTLALPDPNRIDDVESLAECEAVSLFVARAQAVNPSLRLSEGNAQAIADICIRLDGLPLAIELAAARSKLLSPKTMLERLEDPLRVLTAGPRDLPARQQTLRGAIDWSYDLLDQDDRQLFARLAVFAGGATLEAVEAVCGADFEGDVLDALGSLLNKSLLWRQARADGEPRFLMLETIREYALERLEAGGEAETVRRRHAEHFIALAERAEAELRKPRADSWIGRLEDEQDNIRAAVSWLSSAGEHELLLRLVVAIWFFWYSHGYWSEGRGALDLALATVRDGELPSLRADALYAAFRFARAQDDVESARAFAEESFELSEALRDHRAIARSIRILGKVALDEGDDERASVLLEESLTLSRGAEDWRGVLDCLLNLSEVALLKRDYEGHAGLLEQGEALMPNLQDDRSRSMLMLNLGYLALVQRDLDTATGLFERTRALSSELGDKEGLAIALFNLGLAALVGRRYEHAETFLGDSLRLSADLHFKKYIRYCLEGFAAIAAARGQAARAARLLGAAHGAGEARTALELAEREIHDETESSARAQLGEQAYGTAWRDGCALGLERAITEVLEPVPSVKSRPGGER